MISDTISQTADRAYVVIHDGRVVNVYHICETQTATVSPVPLAAIAFASHEHRRNDPEQPVDKEEMPFTAFPPETWSDVWRRWKRPRSEMFGKRSKADWLKVRRVGPERMRSKLSSSAAMRAIKRRRQVGPETRR